VHTFAYMHKPPAEENVCSDHNNS